VWVEPIPDISSADDARRSRVFASFLRSSGPPVPSLRSLRASRAPSQSSGRGPPCTPQSGLDSAHSGSGPLLAESLARITSFSGGACSSVWAWGRAAPCAGATDFAGFPGSGGGRQNG
jgi:hypothetical protein